MTAPAWPRPRALLLDAMGTLIQLRRPLGHTYAEAAAAHGIAVDPEAVGRAFAAVYASAPPLAFPGLEGEALREAEIGWWGERIEAVLQRTAGVPAPKELPRALFEAFADPALWRVYDDVPANLERWQAAGLRLAVVSNFDSRLEGLLSGLGLARWFDTVVVSSSDVKQPIAVRYGWAGNPDVSLYNRAGLPASPFRTDDWPFNSKDWIR